MCGEEGYEEEVSKLRSVKITPNCKYTIESRRLISLLNKNGGELYKKDLIKNFNFKNSFLLWVTVNHSAVVKERGGVITTKQYQEPLKLTRKKYVSLDS